MSAKAAEVPTATEAAKPKGKSKLILIAAAVLVLAGGSGAGAWYFLDQKARGADHDEAAAAPAKAVVPTYMAMENMVVNLADDGGERFAQIGITLDLDNDKVAEQVKTFMPVIRSKVLLLVSQRSSEELLKRDGKEKLATDITIEVAKALGHEAAEPKARADKAAKSGSDDEVPQRKGAKAAAPSPVRGVLFSSFIVQ